MYDSGCAEALDDGCAWELESGASTPRSDTSSSSQDSVFSKPSTPVSPADTEMSFPSLGPDDEKQPGTPTKSNIASIMPQPNHVLAGNAIYTTGQLRAMSDELAQAQKTGEFPSTSSSTEHPQTIVEDYQHLKRLRDARGNPSLPPPEKYLMVKADIACRIKARDEAEASSPNFEHADTRVQGWMNSINQEARMLEITQAALQRRGISDPTQDDYDTIADEFMQIAERTLLDVANPLRLNASRMEGNMSRFDSQLNGFDGAMASQIGAMTSLNTTINNSMTAQLSTLNTMLSAQSNTFNGSLSMLNTSLGTVTTNLHELTVNLPAIIAAAAQTAVQEHFAAASYQQAPFSPQRHVADAPPSYTTNMAATSCQPINRAPLPEYVFNTNQTTNILRHQGHDRLQARCTPKSKSKLRRFFGRISIKWASSRGTSQTEGIPV